MGCAGAGIVNCSNPSKQSVVNTVFHSVPDGLVYGPKQNNIALLSSGDTESLFVSFCMGGIMYGRFIDCKWK